MHRPPVVLFQPMVLRGSCLDCPVHAARSSGCARACDGVHSPRVSLLRGPESRQLRGPRLYGKKGLALPPSAGGRSGAQERGPESEGPTFEQRGTSRTQPGCAIRMAANRTIEQSEAQPRGGCVDNTPLPPERSRSEWLLFCSSFPRNVPLLSSFLQLYRPEWR